MGSGDEAGQDRGSGRSGRPKTVGTEGASALTTSPTASICTGEPAATSTPVTAAVTDAGRRPLGLPSCFRIRIAPNRLRAYGHR